MTGSQVILGIMGIAMYANPVLLLFAWVQRLRANFVRSVRGWFGWVSLGLASIGLIAFVCFISLGPPVATPAFDRWARLWLRISALVSILTFLTGLVGKGKGQWAVPVSAVATFSSVVLQIILE